GWSRSRHPTRSGAPAGARAWRCASRCISMPTGARSRPRIRTLGVNFDQPTTRDMIQAVAHTVIGHADELTELDRAIGDADHGVNLERGFKAVLANIDAI